MSPLKHDTRHFLKKELAAYARDNGFVVIPEQASFDAAKANRVVPFQKTIKQRT